MKLIIAEDDANLINMISPYLKEKGYEVDWVPDGKELLKKIKSVRFDIIISDIHMPDMSGVEVLKNVRLMEEYKRTPFILWSGIAIEEGEKISKEYEKVRFMKKPFTVRQLEDFICELTRLEIIDSFSDSQQFKLEE